MNDKRNHAVLEMFLSCKTLQEIGNTFGFSRENARKIVKRLGAKPTDGGHRKRSKIRRAMVRKIRDAKCLEKFGISLDEREALIEKYGTRLFRAFYSHQYNSRRRGIKFLMTFAQWWGVWKSSGKLDERGILKDEYVMSRPGDCGPYAIDNVRIITASENHNEYHRARKSGLSTKFEVDRKGV